MQRCAIRREPWAFVYRESASFKDTYGGEPGHVFLECLRILPEGRSSKTAIVFSHPIGGGAWLPMVSEMARAGHHVLYVNTRYRGNDTALIMEKCVLDLGAGLREARERFGYERFVLGGWSGGGSLSLFYQDQAEHPTITETPAGDPVDLVGAELPTASGILLLAAHTSRARTLTEWLDASILDETDPTRRETDLDLYHPDGPQPPYEATFLEAYRAAQVARNRRITSWVRERLTERVERDGPGAELGFVVHGTMAAPEFLDPSVDPSDREPGVCYLGDPRTVNMGPVGLARFCTLRSWLSQWSLEETHADGTGNASRVGCPVFLVQNTADTACTPSHAQRLFDAVGHADKERVDIVGATHYYVGQPELCRRAVDACTDWMRRRDLTDP